MDVKKYKIENKNNFKLFLINYETIKSDQIRNKCRHLAEKYTQ